MKYLVLFERFNLRYTEKKKLPGEGIMEVRDQEELETLFHLFRKRGYIEGYRNERSTVEAWITEDWSKKVPSGEKVYFQWVLANLLSAAGKNNLIYCQTLTPREVRDGDEIVKVYNFDEYFDLKPEFRGHKLKKYGI
jgi:hypothetical protein